MLYIYTENLFLFPRFKNYIKAILGKGIRGPQGVESSLIQGLEENGQEFCVNEKFKTVIETACVISGVETLKWAINQKQQGLIKKIVAGPNLVVTPNDSEGILKSKLIDKVIVPSQWVKDFYISVAPELKDKIYIWAAGVDVPEITSQAKNIDFLILNKIKDSILSNQISDLLNQKRHHIQILNYGEFTQQDYFKFLEKSKYLIYLSESESQGLAMFEAWARNVPVLILEKGERVSPLGTWKGLVASPFVNSENGERFSDIENFSTALDKFLANQYEPRQLILNNFTNKISAQNYLTIINA